MKHIEILAPAGSKESIYSALKLGADAVYVGTRRFGARAFANNPSVEELIEALVYAHLRNKKIYLTVNTLLYENEIEKELYDMIAPLYEAGLDACIVQDVGVLSFLHRNFPEMELHGSTQMTLLSGEEAELYRPFGMTRFVPARELSIDEISRARQETDMEMEVFVHGALCFCYSGQCLMSEVIGGRSGNRGMCAQPCRFLFQTGHGAQYALNTKDICTLEYIPELIEAGIDSFKIEGRMKRMEYGAYMAYLYRKYVDVYQKEGKEAFDALRKKKDSELWSDYKKSQDLYNRGGFSGGYLFETDREQLMERKRTGHHGVFSGVVKEVKKDGCIIDVKEDLHAQDVLEFRAENGTKAYEYTLGKEVKKGDVTETKVLHGSLVYPGQKVYRTKNNALLLEIKKQIEETDDTILLKGTFVAECGKPVLLKIEGSGVTVSREGEIWQKAEKHPLWKEEIEKKLCALGNTKYHFSHFNTDIKEEGFLPLSGLKKLRREAIRAWEREAACYRKLMPAEAKMKRWEKAGTKKSVIPVISVSSIEQLQAALPITGKNVLFHLKLADIMPDQWKMAKELLEGRDYMISFPSILHGAGKENFEYDFFHKYPVFKEENCAAFLINSARSLLYARKYFSNTLWITAENMYEMNSEARWANEKLLIQAHMVRAYGRVEVMKSAGNLTASRLQAPKGDRFLIRHHARYGYHSVYTEEPLRTKELGTYTELDFTWESEKEVLEVIRTWNLLLRKSRDMS